MRGWRGWRGWAHIRMMPSLTFCSTSRSSCERQLPDDLAITIVLVQTAAGRKREKKRRLDYLLRCCFLFLLRLFVSSLRYNGHTGRLRDYCVCARDKLTLDQATILSLSSHLPQRKVHCILLSWCVHSRFTPFIQHLLPVLYIHSNQGKIRK